MKIGIVGVGLIGGSFAMAYHKKGHEVLAYDTDNAMLDFAMLSGDVDGVLNKDNVSACDLILVCIFPRAAVEWITDNAPYFGEKPIVVDCCGTKREVCSECFPVSEKYSFTYVGGHPMAGTHNSGYKFARADMFEGAPMVIVPPSFDDIELLGRLKELLSPAGFGSFSVTTARQHDRMIAFTSQLAHVVSNAYVKSPSSKLHRGFSAGSYKDLTRVAWLNPQMWAELFMDNKDYLETELDIIISNLQKYRDAIHNNDTAALTDLLEEGRRIKEEVDG